MQGRVKQFRRSGQVSFSPVQKRYLHRGNSQRAQVDLIGTERTSPIEDGLHLWNW
jgi:hypothetical protein